MSKIIPYLKGTLLARFEGWKENAMNSDMKPSDAKQGPQSVADNPEQSPPATPAPVSDEVRPGDTASSREYADKLGKEMLGDEYTAGQREDEEIS
jgi:hypothetical protein